MGGLFGFDFKGKGRTLFYPTAQHLQVTFSVELKWWIVWGLPIAVKNSVTKGGIWFSTLDRLFQQKARVQFFRIGGSHEIRVLSLNTRASSCQSWGQAAMAPSLQDGPLYTGPRTASILQAQDFTPAPELGNPHRGWWWTYMHGLTAAQEARRPTSTGKGTCTHCTSASQCGPHTRLSSRQWAEGPTPSSPT